MIFFNVIVVVLTVFVIGSCRCDEEQQTNLIDVECYEILKDGPLLQQVTSPVEHGEEPHWDPVQNVLYFVDIHQRRVYRYHPASGNLTSVLLDGGDVSPVIPIRNTTDKFVVGVGRTVSLLTWDGNNLKENEKADVKSLTTVDTDKPTNRFNDGKADAYGRLWLGTIGFENSSGVVPDQASLYRIVANDLAHPQKVISPVTNSNGLAWTKDNTKFYYIDTPTRHVAVYDFDLKNGTISNKRIAFDLSKYNITGFPDGMTIDADDNLWVAVYNGGSVLKVNPRDGTLLQRIAIPAARVTSCMFGGTEFDTLFVTTSKFGLSQDELQQQPSAGAVFAISNLKGVRGVPTYTAVLDTTN